MREHRRTPKKRKSGGGTRNKRHRGGSRPVSLESVTLVEEPQDTPSVQESYTKMQDKSIDLYIEKKPTVSVILGTKSYIKFIKCINSNALDKLSKIMYSTLLNKDDDVVQLLIQESLCLYKLQNKSEIENKIIGNLKTLEGDVKDLKDKIDKFSREFNSMDVKKFHDDIMSSDNQYFNKDKEDFKGMFVNIVDEFNSGIIGFRGNEVSRKIFEKEEKEMKKRNVTDFELNKFYLFNIIDFMIFMGIKVKEELEEYLEAINQLIKFNNDIVKLKKNIEKGEEEANKKEEVMMILRELFRDNPKKDFILKKVVDQITDASGNNLLLDLKLLIDENKVAEEKEKERIEAQIRVKKTELDEEINKFKINDNDNITQKLQEGIELMDESKVENPKDKEDAEKVKSLLQELVDEKKKLEQISKTQTGGAAQALPESPDAEIQQINKNIKDINRELEDMKENREQKMREQDNNWTWRDDPLFMYYYYTSMGNALGNLLSYQIEFWSNLKLSVGDSLGDLSDIDIGGSLESIVGKVGNGIGGAEAGLTEAAIASQELITGFLSGGVEILGVVFSAGADIIGGIWSVGGDIVGGLGSVVEVIGEGLGDLASGL